MSASSSQHNSKPVQRSHTTNRRVPYKTDSRIQHKANCKRLRSASSSASPARLRRHALERGRRRSDHCHGVSHRVVSTAPRAPHPQQAIADVSDCCESGKSQIRSFPRRLKSDHFRSASSSASPARPSRESQVPVRRTRGILARARTGQAGFRPAVHGHL